MDATSVPMRILWLNAGPLHPLNRGGNIRTRNMLRELKKRHHVTFLALFPDRAQPPIKDSASEYSHEQIWIAWKETPKFTLRFYIDLLKNFAGSDLPYVIEKYRSPAMAKRIQELDATGTFDLIVCDFLTPSANLFANGFRPATRTLIFQHNVESKLWERTFQTARGAVRRFYFRGQWRRLLAFEKTAAARFHSVVGVSEDDCRVMRDELGLKNVSGAVPTGVDLSFFVPQQRQPKPRSLVFLGSMDWMPNIDAVKYFTAQIFPLVKQRSPAARLTIVGRNPPQSVRELAKDSAIEVTGTVEDVRPHLAGAQVMVVPLRVGGGTRIKIFEAMATGIPIVSTSIGAEGLPVRNGEQLFICDTPQEFANTIRLLFEQPELRARIGENGRELVKRHFGWEQATRQFERLCLAAAGGNRGEK